MKKVIKEKKICSIKDKFLGLGKDNIKGQKDLHKEQIKYCKEI